MKCLADRAWLARGMFPYTRCAVEEEVRAFPRGVSTKKARALSGVPATESRPSRQSGLWFRVV